VKIWLGAVKKDLCMLTAPCQILTFNFLCFYVYNILCIVEHPKYNIPFPLCGMCTVSIWFLARLRVFWSYVGLAFHRLSCNQIELGLIPSTQLIIAAVLYCTLLAFGWSPQKLPWIYASVDLTRGKVCSLLARSFVYGYTWKRKRRRVKYVFVVTLSNSEVHKDWLALFATFLNEY
jgi:hypothetical protein